MVKPQCKHSAADDVKPAQRTIPGLRKAPAVPPASQRLARARRAVSPGDRPPASAHVWAITDHVCGACFGRILERDGPAPGLRVYRCTNCGAEQAGQSTRVVCACGVKLKTGRSIGLRCERNPEPTPEFPSEVLASETAVEVG